MAFKPINIQITNGAVGEEVTYESALADFTRGFRDHMSKKQIEELTMQYWLHLQKDKLKAFVCE